MKRTDLLEKRTGLVGQMRQIHDSAAGASRDLTADEQVRFDALSTETRALEAQITRQESLDEFERRMRGGTTLTGYGDDRFDTEVRSFSLLRAIAAQVPNLNVDCGREREISTELQRRSGRTAEGLMVPLSVFHQPVEQRVLTSTPGAALISTDHNGQQYIDRLRAALRVRALGARILSGLVGNLDIPRLTGSVAAGWVAENAAIDTSDNTFDKVSLTPKHCGAITELSRNMLMQSSPDVEQLVRGDFAAVLAEAVDRVAIKGGGTNEPTGILGTGGIGSVAMGSNGGIISWGKVLDLIAEVEGDDALDGSLAFLTNSKVVKSARQTLKTTGDTASNFVMSSPNELAGYALRGTKLAPSNLTKGTSNGVCSALIFGNWADLLIGYWSEFDLLVNPFESTAYAKGNVQVRGMLTMDVKLRHAESFAAIQDLTTA